MVNFFIGSFLLAIGCVVVGELTLPLAIRWNRRHFEALSTDARQKESLSIQAYKMADPYPLMKRISSCPPQVHH